MESDWIKIFSSADFFSVELLRQALVEQNIPAVLLNKKDSSYGFGQVELYVGKDYEKVALEIIREVKDEE